MAEAVSIVERRGFGIATVMARKGVGANAIGEALGLDAPSGPRWSAGNEMMLIGAGPDMWLAMVDVASPDWAADVGRRLAGLAAVSDQSGGYVVYRVEGPAARTLLQRGVFLDLDPTLFARRAAAVTVIAHIGVVLWQVDEGPTFDIALFRSFGGSFQHWLETALAAL